ncbi:MAG: DUF2298 domain-containing protein [Chloroflexota bacterium]|nr:DUF2298 domain-containing protein [Chloroflexota bacterium]
MGQIFEWFSREGMIVLAWWALVTAAGAAVLPLCFRMFGGLPDRGYTLARAVGVLVVAFVYWLLASFGFLRNTTGNIVLAWALTLGVGVAVYFALGRNPKSGGVNYTAWWRSNRAAILTAEVLFITILIGWSIFRAHQNGIVATEKPMEQAFMSAVMRSETFPPNDPWMAGYAISYYYFGYVMIGMLAMMSGISSSVAFNLSIALLFALTGVTVFGVVYNLVRSRVLIGWSARAGHGFDVRRGQGVAVSVGLVGALFVAVLGNFATPVIELPYETGTASAEYLAFFDAKDRGTPRGVGATDLSQWQFWWWFNSARVLNDRNLDGSREEVIDEFPMFSFLLADNHPHVLALPFAALAVGLMLNALMRRQPFGVPDSVFYAVCLGGLSFLNTWDGPIYTVGVIGALALRRLLANRDARLHTNDWVALIGTGAALFALSFALYLPFWVGFRSQLAGVLPNLMHPTAFQQFAVHFAPFLLILIVFVAVEAWRGGARFNWRMGIGAGVGLFAVLLAAMILFGVVGYINPGTRASVEDVMNRFGGSTLFIQGVVDKRISHIFTSLFLTIGIILVVGRLFPRADRMPDDPETPEDESQFVNARYAPQTGFALLLVGMGLALTLAPEFVYLRDNFSTRMNTIFKFYYQAWLLWGVASAYAVFSILFDGASKRQPGILARAAFVGVVAVVITGGLMYPILSTHNRALIETGRANYPRENIDANGQTFVINAPPLTLDGGSTTAGVDDYAAVICLGELVTGDNALVIAGVGNSYDSGTPASGLTGRLVGIPVLYNWPGHQGQWRGETLGQVAGSRQEDIERLYVDPTWNTARDILLRYNPDYIFYGEFERFKYGTDGEIKFRDRLPIVCEYGNSRFYRVEPNALME